jgi:hypothetical protein
MNTKTPAQTPEGRLIEEATKASGRSVRTLAANAGISDTRWRHIVKGWQSTPGGGQAPVRAPAATLARMAYALGLTPEQLDEVGRSDAVPELQRLQREGVGVGLATAAGAAYDAQIRTGAADEIRTGAADEIELIYASKSMSALEKLAAIRMVLQLRAEVERTSGEESES